MKNSKYELLNPKQITNSKSEIQNILVLKFSISCLEFSAYELEGAKR